MTKMIKHVIFHPSFMLLITYLYTKTTLI